MKKVWEELFNKKIFTVTFIFWSILNILEIPNLYFTANISVKSIAIKVLHLFFMYFIFYKIYLIYMNRDTQKGRYEINVSFIYFYILMLLLILIWPGTWSWDDIMILSNASNYNCTAWQHIFSGIFQILCLQTIPIATGSVIIQCLIASLIVGYCISNISILFGKSKKQQIIIQVVLFLIALFPPILLYVFSGFRMGIYSYIELLLISQMLIIYKRKKELVIQDILLISFFTIIISCWRTEGIYYPFLIMILFFILGKKIIKKRIVIIMFLGILIVSTLIGKYNNLMIGTNNYFITGTIEPVTSIIKITNETDKEELDIIDKVIDVDYVRENPDNLGEAYYWTEGVVQSYSDEEYSNYLKAYLKLAIKYPDVILDSMWKMFIRTGSGVGEDYKQTTRNMITGGGNTLKLFEPGDGANLLWNDLKIRLKQPINKDIRNNIISLLAGIDSNNNLTIIHNIFWNLFIPFILIFICLIYKLIKKDWFMVFLILIIIARIPLVFITSPAPYFMYYLSAYLCSYVLAFIIIFEFVCNWKEKRAKNNKYEKEKILAIENKEVKENKILLFIPGYNCEKQITKVLDQVTPEVLEYISEIIFINNRSTDNTEKVVLEYKKRKPELPLHVFRNDDNYNLGGSHKVAFDYAMKNKFDYVVILHGDNQGDIKDLLPVLKSKEYEKYDCSLGARFMKGSKLDGYSKFRTFGNRVYNILFSIVLHKRIYDLGSGLNLYSVRMLENKFYYKFPDRLTFNYCMILASHYYKHNICFFPITWREEDQVSNVKMTSQAISVLKMLFKYFIKHDYITEEFREKKIKKYTSKEIINEK